MWDSYGIYDNIVKLDFNTGFGDGHIRLSCSVADIDGIDTEFTHYAITFDGTDGVNEVCLYINGELKLVSSKWYGYNSNITHFEHLCVPISGFYDGTIPEKSTRLRLVCCTERERLAITRMVSFSCCRVKARTLRFSGYRNSILPRPKARNRFRFAMSRFVHQRRESWLFCCVSTFIAS